MRVVILGSGKGSNAEAILQAQAKGRLGRADVVGILTDRSDAGILEVAARHHVVGRHVDAGPYRTKLEGAGEENYIRAVSELKPDLVVLAGFMRVLKPGFLRAFGDRLINLHPSLLPSFPGLDAIGQALRAGVRITGCTVHRVTDAVDAGPIIDQKEVRVIPGETLESLTARVHDAEHELLPAVVARLSESG